jgi:hypothetical protein
MGPVFGGILIAGLVTGGVILILWLRRALWAAPSSESADDTWVRHLAALAAADRDRDPAALSLALGRLVADLPAAPMAVRPSLRALLLRLRPGDPAVEARLASVLRALDGLR